MCCAVVAPKLENAFSNVLGREGWDVHTQMEDLDLEGPSLEEAVECEGDREAALLAQMRALEAHEPKRALILKTSHIGGHKYAGNVIVSRNVVCVALYADSRLDIHAVWGWGMVRARINARGRADRSDNDYRRTRSPTTASRRR